MANEELVELLKRDVGKWNAFVEERGAEDKEWRADLTNADLSHADLSHADLSHANLFHANLFHANLFHAILSGSNPRRAILSGANLRSAILSGAILAGADLTDADLTDATFSGADLRRADLRRADLTDANLFRANLTDATLSDTILFDANLSRAILAGANLTECRTGGTIFANVDLGYVNDLARVRHLGSSTVGTNTLALSQGKIPDAFLKGCGLAEWEIAQAKLYNPNLQPGEVTEILYEVDRLRNTGPIQINPIFLSYAHTDADTVDRLHDKLQSDGIRCWRDKHELTAGPIEDQVDRAMRVNPTVVLVLSEASVESDWVEWEAEKARELEKKEDAAVLCPIALDDAWRTCAWPGRLRKQIEKNYVIPFHELGFDEGYARLKKGLPIYYSGKGKRDG